MIVSPPCANYDSAARTRPAQASPTVVDFARVLCMNHTGGGN